MTTKHLINWLFFLNERGEVNAQDNPPVPSQEPAAVAEEETPASPETEPVQQDPAEQAAEPQAAPQPAQPETIDPNLYDDRGVPWKNVAMEARRKLEEAPQIIRQTVDEVMKEHNKAKQPEYTIEQLEAFAIENPHNRPWAEARKAEIIQRNLEKTLDTRLQEDKRVSREQTIRQESEAWVVNNPVLKDCFVSDATGAKVWNYANPLTQVMGRVLQEIDPATGKKVQDHPAGLRIAAEIAYGRMMLTGGQATTKQVTQLKRDLRKVQKQTIIPSAGAAPQAQSPRSGVRKSLDNFVKTGSKQELRAATRSYLAASGIIKEE